MLVSFTSRGPAAFGGSVFLFVMELACYKEHIMNHSVALQLQRLRLHHEQGLKYTGIHRLVKGLGLNDRKVVRRT